MIVNNIDKLLESYKSLGKSFKMRKSANYIELVTSAGDRIYHNKTEKFKGGLFLFGMVKRDIKAYLEKNGNEIDMYEELPVNFKNESFDNSQEVIGIDINNAYWSVARLKRYISLKTYRKGLEKKEYKTIRLSALSSLGKQRVYNVYENGEHTSDEVVNGDERLRNIYNDIRYSTFGVMREVAEELGDDFESWKTDCVFFKDTKQNREIATTIIESYGLECKIEDKKIMQKNKVEM